MPVIVDLRKDHITQRGNNRQDVFFTDDDFRAYLELLKQQTAKYGFELEG